MSKVLIEESKPIFEYLKSLDDYVVLTEDENMIVLERVQLSGVPILIIDDEGELYFQVNLCPVEKVKDKLPDLLKLNANILPAAYAIDDAKNEVILVSSIFTDRLNENEVVSTLVSICNGVEEFAEQVLA